MIAETANETQGVINRLIESCLEWREQLCAAARAYSDPQVQRELSEFCRQQEKFAQELAKRLTAYGDAPAGAAGTGSREQPSRFDSIDAHGILLACERSSTSTLAAFRHVLGEEMPPEFGNVIELQFEMAQESA